MHGRSAIHGVAYGQMSVLFVNAFKEQQAQIALLQQQVNAQRNELDLVRSLFCSQNAAKGVCPPVI